MLVTDADERSALAACRGLAQAGYRVTAAAGVAPAAGHWSRSSHRRLTVPDPRQDPRGFLNGLQTALDQEQHSILLASTDLSTWLISENRERFEGLCRLAMPEREVVRASLDKGSLVAAAPSVGLAAPASTICDSVDDAYAAADELGLPVILKSARSFVASSDGFVQKPVVLVTERNRLATALEDLEPPFLVQRYEQRTRVVSCSGLMTPGALLGFAVVRWERRWPVAEGATSYCRTIAPPDGLARRVEELLEGVGFSGIFELELLERPDGELMAIDFNPRLFGWLALPIAAGANFPAMYCDWLRGLSPAVAEARAGVYYRWEDADSAHFVWQLRKGRFKEAAAVLRPRRRVVHPFFQLRDPAPLVARVVLIGRKRKQRRRAAS